MCGRARCTLAPDAVRRLAGAPAARWVSEGRFQPCYNIAPGYDTPVVTRDADSGKVAIQTMTWGLVPSYTKPNEKPNHFLMFNARSESVHEKPSFKRLLPTRRCLVLLDGFYEWKAEKGGKQPYYIKLRREGAEEDEPMVMAGLYDVWHSAQGPIHTYTILTTDSSKRLAWLHDRMPVILRDKAAQELWLNGGGGMQKVLGPYNGEDLRWHPVTKEMSKPSFQGPECCRELKRPSVAAFFQPVKKQQKQEQPAEAESLPSAAATAARGAAKAAGNGAEAVGVKQEDAGGAVAAVNADERPASAQEAERESDAGAAAAAAAASTKAGKGTSPLKRKAPEASGGGSAGKSPGKGGGGKSPGSQGKKARPADQPAISSFFKKG